LQKVLKWLTPAIGLGVAIFIIFFLLAINSNEEFIDQEPLDFKEQIIPNKVNLILLIGGIIITAIDYKMVVSHIAGFLVLGILMYLTNSGIISRCHRAWTISLVRSTCIMARPLTLLLHPGKVFVDASPSAQPVITKPSLA